MEKVAIGGIEKGDHAEKAAKSCVQTEKGFRHDTDP
jgi:hypothetical protein